MAAFKPLIRLEDIKTTLLTNRHDLQLYMAYDDLADTLNLQFVPPSQETVVLTMDDYVGFLYLPDNLEAVGVYIEDVTRGYLNRHPYLNEVWQRWEAAQRSDDPTPGKTSLFLELARELIRALREEYDGVAPQLVEALA